MSKTTQKGKQKETKAKAFKVVYNKDGLMA
jgi:hypothetical protein